MAKYKVMIKRHGQPMQVIEIENGKFSFADGWYCINPIETTSTVMAAVRMLENEDIDWIRFEKE